MVNRPLLHPEGPFYLPDNIPGWIGSAKDGSIVLLRDALAADTAPTVAGVLEGTVEGQALAAGSIVLSNTRNDGDVAVYVSKAGSSQMAFWADGSTGDTAVLAASGQSVDVYIAGVKQIDYADGVLAFQQATIILTTTGNITIAPATALLVTLVDNVASALDLSSSAGLYYDIDTRRATAGIVVHQFRHQAETIASGAAAIVALIGTIGATVTYTGTTQVTTEYIMYDMARDTLAGDTPTLTIDRASAMVLRPPTEGTNVLLTDTIGLHIYSATGTPTNVFGILIDAMSGGTTNNVQLVMANGGTEPANAVVDRVGLYAVDIAAGRATLGIRSEETVIATAELASTHKLVVRINGVSYGIMLTTTLT